MKNLPRLLSVRDLVKMYNLTAQSQLSQNFILDKNITDKVVKSAMINSNNLLVVEVGPGPGLLTRSILETGVPNMIVIEKDARFLPALTQLSEASNNVLKIIQDDILEIDHEKILTTAQINKVSQENRLHVIGNLPFNISTPLLVQWMKMLSKRSGIFQISDITMTLMFQKEVGDRIVADTFSPVRSRLSVLVQSLCEARKVDAALIQLIALKEPILNVPIDKYEMVVRYFFGQRRKTLQSLLKALTKKLTADEVDRLIKGLEQLDINLSLRPEKLTSEQFCRVTKVFCDNSISIPTN
ncbi:S-adenosyl-L-methionine-dependent methyltransferase [Gigaspora margarita]|uniref:rRNA adenine N(6)-methyltransferase n=1 Tax=Gigaspora margarita TaxID=4874 RepID=A0A8H3XC88_GIGMA|nr:S-adenosyl-L-methionine-dependent methyltransferase [Gigaspora margarita]